MKRHIPAYIIEAEAAINRAYSGLTYSDDLKDMLARLRTAQTRLIHAKFYVERAKNKDDAARVLPELHDAFAAYKVVGDEVLAVKAQQDARYAAREVIIMDTSSIGRMISEHKAARPGSNWTGD